MSELPLKPIDSEESRPAEKPEIGDQKRRPWDQKTRRNHWAHRDPLDFATFPRAEPMSYLKESRLIERAQNGDLDARNQVWCQYLRLAFSVVNRYAIPPSMLSDAIQEAAIGLHKAIERFDVHRYLAFSTYAWIWMSQCVGKLLMDQRHGIRISAHFWADFHRFRKGLHRCRSSADWFDWRDEWLAEDGNLYERLAFFNRLAQPEPIQAADDMPDALDDPLKRLLDSERVHILHQALHRLPSRHRRILERRYGLRGRKERTLKEIGEGIGITRERVRQLQVNAEKRLRRKLARRLGEQKDNNAGESAGIADGAHNGDQQQESAQDRK